MQKEPNGRPSEEADTLDTSWSAYYREGREQKKSALLPSPSSLSKLSEATCDKAEASKSDWEIFSLRSSLPK